MAVIYIPSDPLFHLQWHLLNQGNTPDSVAGYDINVVSVWPDYTGRGILVGVMDQGMDETHPDLAPNYRADLAWDVHLNVPGATVRQADDNHGVVVAGLVAAVGGNGIGGVGVAWGAEFTMYRAPLRDRPDEDSVLSFQRAAEKMLLGGADISVNSWGLGLGPYSYQHQWGDIEAAARSLAQYGRDGLGIATVFSAGNAAEKGSVTSEGPPTDTPWVIVVGAGSQSGGVAGYSTPGASVLVTAPGADPQSIVAPDRQGDEGYNTEPGVAGDYTTTASSYFSGTSAAAPIAAGVVALVLEANGGLGYRDVQEILVYSSSRATFLDREYDYAFNGARDWNGGALLGSHDFGYGHIDAHAAVRLAESWMKTATVANLVVEQGQVGQLALMVEAGRQADVHASFAVDYRVEQMLVTVDLQTDRLQAVTIELISPDGTVSRLVNEPPLYDPEMDPDPYELPTRLEYPLNTVLHWGESLAGEWTLRIRNNADGDTVTLNNWSIEAYAAGGGGGTQIFTDEFARFADFQAGRTVVDAANGAVLNAAAVTRDVHFDLAAGTGAIGDTALALADAGGMRHLVSGDGNDVLVGNAADNILMAGRGDNVVDGGAGLDALRLIGEYGHYSIEPADGAVAIHSHALSGGGTDLASNVEVLVFADQVVLTNTPVNLGADLFDEAAYLGQNPDVAAAIAAGQLASGRVHYARWGEAEGRNPNDLFSEAWYLAAYADVAQAVQAGTLASGFLHYQSYGWAEGRNPSAWLDAGAYLAANSDVAAAQVDPFQHFLMYGLQEGRTITATGVDAWVV